MQGFDTHGLIARGVALALAAGLIGASTGCSAKEEPEDEDTGMMPSTGAAGSGMPSASAGSGNSAGSTGQAGGSAPGNMGSSGSSSAGSAAPSRPNEMPAMQQPPPPEVMEMLDPKVDWKALTIVYTNNHSAHDGQHNFVVPLHVDGAEPELSDWKAIPASAVTFDADPDTGGVLVTINEAVAEITIAVSTGDIGGTAPIHVTKATPAEWEAGNKRYNNGVDFMLPDLDFSAILDPNWMPPMPPPNLACNNCHSSGAKYFEIQHTPTQMARFSDAELTDIFTKGTKPPGYGFRVLPPMLGSTTNVQIYEMYHKWDTTPEEIKGLIVYLRGLTPAGQGDILLPGGMYVPAPENRPMMP